MVLSVIFGSLLMANITTNNLYGETHLKDDNIMIWHILCECTFLTSPSPC